MADTLAAKTCTPCKGGIPPLTLEQAQDFQRQVPGWELQNDAHRIERKFKFRNFSEALRFVTQVAERHDHGLRAIGGTHGLPMGLAAGQ
jgi:4a-hydroxytetrahydrobiopterin dehydratase